MGLRQIASGSALVGMSSRRSKINRCILSMITWSAGPRPALSMAWKRSRKLFIRICSNNFDTSTDYFVIDPGFSLCAERGGWECIYSFRHAVRADCQPPGISTFQRVVADPGDRRGHLFHKNLSSNEYRRSFPMTTMASDIE